MFKKLLGLDDDSKIRANIANLFHRNTGTRQQAASALRNLSNIKASNADANRDTIREAGGIAPLIASLKDSDAVVKEHAVAALSNLSNTVTNRDAIREVCGYPSI